MSQRPAVPDSVDDVDDDPGYEGEGEEETEDLEGEVLTVSSSVAARVAARAVHVLIGGVVEPGDVGDCPPGGGRGRELGDHVQNGIHGGGFVLLFICLCIVFITPFALCLLHLHITCKKVSPFSAVI